MTILVKSGLQFFIFKLNKPLQRYLLTCQANLAFLALLALGSINSEGARSISK